MKDIHTDKIAILLATYNGEKYIRQQLESLGAQTYKDIDVVVRDDKGVDNTSSILNSHNVTVISADENIGAKNSFASLLSYAITNCDAKYFMFCDQDDVWHRDKVYRSVLKIKEMENEFGNVPLLVHSDLEVVDEKLSLISNSFMHYQKIDASKNSFNKLLMQNTITGCTVVINRELAIKCLPMPEKAIIHDWWIGLVASKFGQIGYIDEPTIKYRQHGSNVIGAKGFSFKFVMSSVFKKVILIDNVNQAGAFLLQFGSELDENTKKMLRDFSLLNEQSFFKKRYIIYKYKLFKQGIIRNIGLFIKI